MVKPEDVMADSVLGPKPEKGASLSIYQQRRRFLMSQPISVQVLKQRAKTNDLSVHKTNNQTIDGEKVVKKIFFYPRAFKGSRTSANIVRFVLGADGRYALSGGTSAKHVSKILDHWEKLRPAGGPGPARKRSIQFTPQAVRTVIQMLDGSSNQSTYRQIADRLNDPNTTAYKVNEQERSYNQRDVRNLVDKLFPKVYCTPLLHTPSAHTPYRAPPCSAMTCNK